MSQFRINDNDVKPKTEFSGISKLVNRIADKTVSKLASEGTFVFPEKELLGGIEEDQILLESINDSYRISNVMGFIGYGNECLTISSRFAQKQDDFFLQYLLGRVLNFPNIVDLSTTENRDEQIMNMFVFLFPKYLRDAVRKGLFKTYVNNHYNDMNVKGTINIHDHIVKNTPFTGNIAYDKREYSYDNALTELIRHTIEYIKTRPYGNTILGQVKDEVKAVIDATISYKAGDRVRILSENRKKPIYHAYFNEYRALQQLCILILRQEKYQMGGGGREIYGILFDGAWLWEEYLNLLIGDVFYHPMNKAGKGAQRLFTSQFGGHPGLIYPDFVGKDPCNRIIADAKYKPIKNINSHDYLQVLAYMYRFDAKKGYYLYPKKSDEPDEVLYMNSGSTYENNVKARDNIILIKKGLKIPQEANTYQDFVEQMEKNESAFKGF